MNKTKICYVRAKQKDDYVFDGIKNMGYQILIPYKDYNLFMRCLREAWFRLHMPCRSIWFNTKLKNVSADIFIVKDPLIVPDFLSWLKDKHQNSRVILDYDNRASRTIAPDSVNSDIEKWSYDQDDCKAYGMNLKPCTYLDIYRVDQLDEPKYDVLYLGRDKGRASELFEIQSELEKLGLKVYFHICADRAYMRRKHSYYKPYITYGEYLNLLKQSRAILNVMPAGQKSITQREMEAVFDGVKCITTNEAIVNFELYHPSRFFILGSQKLESLPDFLAVPFQKVDEQTLKKYTFDSFLESMIGQTTHIC